jgi:DNA topoisomerase-1
MRRDAPSDPEDPPADRHAQGAAAPLVVRDDPPLAEGLVYVSDDMPGIRRRRAGRGFTFTLPGRGRITDAATIARIRKLAIPPAYTDVWICPDPNGHIQATGRDGRGRKQYRYHPRWVALRDATKFDRLAEFAEVLPLIRSRAAADTAKAGLGRAKVLATVVTLLETTLIRIGNDDYARQNDSYGLTTLRNEHVSVTGSELRFWFEGKSGKTWRLRIRDRRIARVVRTCQELPGQTIFQYLDEDGEPARVTSADVNAWLREVTGRDITAKDFRTWAGTVTAAGTLAARPPPQTATEAKRELKATMEQVAARLGNTASIARKSYVHPAVVEAYVAGALPGLYHAPSAQGPEGLSEAEVRTLAVLGSSAVSLAETLQVCAA